MKKGWLREATLFVLRARRYWVEALAYKAADLVAVEL
jgi:hypothetical protein